MTKTTIYASSDEGMTVQELYDALKLQVDRGNGHLPVYDLAESTVGRVQAVVTQRHSVAICRYGEVEKQ